MKRIVYEWIKQSSFGLAGVGIGLQVGSGDWSMIGLTLIMLSFFIPAGFIVFDVKIEDLQ